MLSFFVQEIKNYRNKSIITKMDNIVFKLFSFHDKHLHIN